MALQLIERWQLAVLRVRLDAGRRVPAVAAELISYAGGSARTIGGFRHPLPDYGLSDRTGPPDALHVPADLREAVAEALHGELRGESSLWIQLVGPYGYLGAVPWERDLLPVADIPVFRVPDRLPVTADPGRRWSVAIGIDAQPDGLWATDYVAGLVRELRATVGPELEVDVFADAGTAGRLRENWESSDWAHLHEPADAREASRVRVRRVTSASRDPAVPMPLDLTSPGRIWADWITTGLAGRAVRALHIVLDTVWDDETPVLALSPDPSTPARTQDCAFVSAQDVRRLADNVGAATLSFGTAADRGSDSAMRMIADAVGQLRPGTTIHTDVRDDPGGAALARMHGFLAGSVDRTPRHRSLFAYLQPEQVRSVESREWHARTPAALPRGYESPAQDDVGAIYGDAVTVPAWVAASERYVGQELANLTRGEGSPETAGWKDAYERGSAEGLTELQAIVAKHARRS